MAEAYPSDNSLLNMIEDIETGVEYIETGKAPYYLEFRRLLHRLLLSTRRANDLRVFDEGGLDIGVKAGCYFSGGDLIEYAGGTGNALADNKEAIYIYLDAEGNLVTDEYEGFPAPAVEHIRLAVVTTGGGDISDIKDVRGQHFIQGFAPALADSVVKEAAAGSEVHEGVTTGILACKRIGTAELKPLLDGNGAANNLFSVGAGDRIVRVEFLVKAAAGIACTVDIGFDAVADGESGNPDGWLTDADANSAGFYCSDDENYNGDYVPEGKAAAGDGHVTIQSSADVSSGNFEGQVVIWYIAA